MNYFFEMNVEADDLLEGKESGVALIMALWILSLLVIVAATMTIGARYTVNSTESIKNLRRAQSISESGIENWVAQLRGDVIVDDEGVQPTEIMNHNPITPPANVRINEIKAADVNDWTCDVNPGFHVELVNVGRSPQPIGGWFGTLDNFDYLLSNNNAPDGAPHGNPIPDDIVLCPLRGDGACVSRGSNFRKFYAIGTPDWSLTGGNITTDATIKICDDSVNQAQCRNANPGDPELKDYVQGVKFSCTGTGNWFNEPDQCSLTWQVFPDGANGMKPNRNRDLTNTPNNWSKAPCTMDADNDGAVERRFAGYYNSAPGNQVTQYNGSGFWLKSGDYNEEGLRLGHNQNWELYDFGSDVTFDDLGRHGMLGGQNGFYGGDLGNSDVWNAPYCERIDDNCKNQDACVQNCNFKENFFVDTSRDAGDAMAVITNGLPRETLIEVFPDADTTYQDVNGHTHLIPVIPTGIIEKTASDGFPNFENDDYHYLVADIPKPEDQELGAPPPIWSQYRSRDRYDNTFSSLSSAAEINSLETGSDEHDWIVRVDTGQSPSTSLNRSDSVPADPDPGTYNPANYSVSSSDYVFNDETKADSRLYISESYDSQVVAGEHPRIENECNLKITFGRNNDNGSGPNFLEIFNPGPKSYTLTEVHETYWDSFSFSEDTRFDGDETLAPGEFFVLSTADDHDDFPNLGSSEYDGIVDYTASNLYENGSAAWKIRGCQETGIPGGGAPCAGVGGGGANGVICDAVAVEKGKNPKNNGADWGEGDPIKNNNVVENDFLFWRKKSSVFHENVPEDSGDNKSDFNSNNPLHNGWHEAKDLKWHRLDNLDRGHSNYHYFSRSFVEVHQFKGPERKIPEGGEYIEIYNTGDTVDVRSLEIRDYLDARGSKITGGNDYDLELHDFDPLKGTPDEDQELKPGQVGLIMRESDNIDTTNIGWRPDGIAPFLKGEDVNNDGKGDTIRVYTTEQSDSFLTGGIHNSKPENIKLEDSDKVISTGSWDQDCTLTNRSCYKARIDGAQSAYNWNNLSAPGGTPGEVKFIDHLDEEWGWGGRMLTVSGDSMPLRDPVCVPSMTSCPDPKSSMPSGDIGFFEFLRIEDESGKINVINPPIRNSYDTETHSLKLGKGNENDTGDITSDDPSVDGRSFLGAFHTHSPAEDIADHPDTSPTLWMSPGGMMTVDGIVPGDAGYVNNTMNDYEHVYTTMRSDTTNRKININTASYEALKAIQINPERTDPTFMTDEMVRTVIERRSCESSYSAGDTLPVESYDCNDNAPFITDRQACQYLENETMDPIDCDIFVSNTTTSSGGIFRAEVRGVVMQDGRIQSEAIWEVMVDRTGANQGEKVHVIFMREMDDF